MNKIITIFLFFLLLGCGFNPIYSDKKLDKSYKGKKVILYFYPRDNTPGCTAQACDLRDNKNLINKCFLGIVK